MRRRPVPRTGRGCRRRRTAGSAPARAAASERAPCGGSPSGGGGRGSRPEPFETTQGSGHGRPDAVPLELVQGGGQLGDEDRVVTQVAEDRPFTQQGPRVTVTVTGELLQQLGPGIVDGERVAAGVNAAQVTEPGRDGEGQQPVRTVAGERLPQ